jgi:fibronectin type 3 domain-containing protein
VDLVWQPVEDGDLAGYNVYRQLLGADSKPTGALERLNASPVQQSSFHDASAVAAGRYRYSVTAVDTEGNESGAVSMVLEPNGQP